LKEWNRSSGWLAPFISVREEPACGYCVSESPSRVCVRLRHRVCLSLSYLLACLLCVVGACIWSLTADPLHYPLFLELTAAMAAPLGYKAVSSSTLISHSLIHLFNHPLSHSSNYLRIHSFTHFTHSRISRIHLIIHAFILAFPTYQNKNGTDTKVVQHRIEEYLYYYRC
jgi:hypothetical protein